jgi:hypothetical protein
MVGMTHPHTTEANAVAERIARMEYARRYREKNKAEILKERQRPERKEAARMYRINNREKFALYNKKWRAANPEKAAESERNSRAKKPERYAAAAQLRWQRYKDRHSHAPWPLRGRSPEQSALAAYNCALDFS